MPMPWPCKRRCLTGPSCKRVEFCGRIPYFYKGKENGKGKEMKQQATVTSKGQITLPLAVRRRLGLKPGDRLTFEDLPDDQFRIRKASLTLDALIGCLSAFALSQPVGAEDIEKARAVEFGDGTDQ
jgi:antitoxin PrlF